MTEEEMKREARLIAIEYMIANMTANLYLLGQYTRTAIEQSHATARAALNSETLSHTDPAKADMWLSEVEESVSKLQSAALESWAAKNR